MFRECGAKIVNFKNNKIFMSTYKSKHGTVSKSPMELYMGFADMRNFVQMLPEDKRQGITADYDTIKAEIQGFAIGVKVAERCPYSRIVLEGDGAPFGFSITLNFGDMGGVKTDFSIEAEADLNFMMKMMIGDKIQKGLDKIVDGLVDVSEGRMPEGVDPSMFKK